MNLKAWIPLAVAIVLGLIAARMAMNVVSTQPDPKANVATNLTSIVVATGDVTPGSILTEQHLKLGKVESNDVPTGAFMSAQPLVGRVVKVALSPNQALLPSMLADNGAGIGVATTLPEGMRAITVDINDVSGVAGFIQPTCRVDVVGTIQNEGKPLAKTVLENIMVLAVGSRTGAPTPPEPGQPVEQARTVTLLCTPEQAEKLELATSSTRIRLVLRNGTDKTTSAGEGITIADLKGGTQQDHTDIFAPTNVSNDPSATEIKPRAISQSRPSKQQWQVEIIKGGQTTTQTFEFEPRKQPQDQNETKAPVDSITSGFEQN